MEKKRKLITIFIVIIALIILIGLIFFMFLAPTPEVKEDVPAIPEQNLLAINTIQNQVQTNNAPIQNVIPKTGVIENDLKRIASSFVERYGTYSNQAGYSNMKDLEIFMSRSMKTWSNNYIQGLINSNSNTDIYYGITTKTVVTETNTFDKTGGKANFTVKAQRKESIGVGANTRNFQQNAKVTMIKEGEVWKVDRVVWEE